MKQVTKQHVMAQQKKEEDDKTKNWRAPTSSKESTKVQTRDQVSLSFFYFFNSIFLSC